MRRFSFAWALLLLLTAGCGTDAVTEPGPSPFATPGDTSTASATRTAPRTPATIAPTTQPTAEPTVALALPATRLRIPSSGIDEVIQASEVVPSTSTVPVGCAAPAPGATTLSVPERGIATPAERIEGLEGTSWIFGHSRWLGAPGVFFALQHIEEGDEVLVDGVDRRSGRLLTGVRFVVASIYLADTDSGGALVYRDDPTASTRIVMQTSVRERGDDRPWILDQATIEAKATVVVDGDLDDRCKYLLLFVVATLAE